MNDAVLTGFDTFDEEVKSWIMIMNNKYSEIKSGTSHLLQELEVLSQQNEWQLWDYSLPSCHLSKMTTKCFLIE